MPPKKPSGTEITSAQGQETIRNTQARRIQPAKGAPDISGGTIAERGKHRDLVEAGGVYAQLYETQFKGAIAPEEEEKIERLSEEDWETDRDMEELWMSEVRDPFTGQDGPGAGISMENWFMDEEMAAFFNTEPY